MFTIARAVENETVISKSRFLCHLHRIDGEDEARAIIEDHRKEHWNANHNCTAFVAADGLTARSSDDGEPSGTAGVPMLEALRGRGLTNVLAIVTRHFGGVKLGAGGLVRAYGGAVTAALDRAELLEIVHWPRLRATVDYDHAGPLEALLRSREEVLVSDVDYGSQVALTLAAEDIAALRDLVNQSTAGAANLEEADPVRLERPVS
ncbi:YigZ family protein [Salininema proteolyticum]|uniref:YigZ family protein n=1 Tax=Salininema proteolyticum TaxID=1607685 RepID=A0ABV8U3V1_9ACTN